ncbi:MAG: M23 family metallopeptidase [Phenylobacterium sp.]
MTDENNAHSGRAHLWKVDAVLGVSAALMAFSVAEAALPTPPLQTRPIAYAVAPPAPPAPAPEPAVLIAFSEPLPGQAIVSPFGRRQLPWEEQGRLHAGVDIAANVGRPILASADGVVVRVSQDAGGYGRFVEVKHAEGLSTLYAHMSKTMPNIAPGVAVKAGTPLGLVGSTGSSTGAHLHFEIRDSQERPLNPTLFLDRKFATSDELPLQAALRMPRGTRVAYVSHVPAGKRGVMQAKLDGKSDDAAATSASSGKLDDLAVAVDKVAGRPHARISMVFSPKETEAPRSDPAA